MQKAVNILAIPLILMIVWSLIVFVISVLGSLGIQIAGSVIVATSLALIGGLIGSVMSLIVGFNTVKQGTTSVKTMAMMGAMFGLLISIVSAFLEIIIYLFSLLTGTTVTTGLAGLSLPIIIDLAGMIDPSIPTIKQSILMGSTITVIGSVLMMFINIISGTLLSIIGGTITKKLGK